MRERRTVAIFGAIALVGLTVGVFGQSVFFDFVDWDDPVYVLQNPLIRDLSLQGVGRIFRSFVSGNYHPLTVLAYAGQYAAWGFDPKGFHAVNVLLHACNAVLAFLLLYRLTGNAVACVLAAAVFAVHPMRVEAVCWVTGTKDLLSAALLLGSLLLYCRWRSGSRSLLYGCSVALFGIAGLAKATTIAGAAFFPLIDHLEGRGWRQELRRYLPFAAIAVALGVAAILARASYQEVLVEDYGSFLGLVREGAWRLVVYYSLRQVFFFVPWLSPYFGDDSGRVLAAIVLAIGTCFLGGVLYLLNRYWREHRELRFGLLFFLVGLLPVLSVPVIGYSADRFSYVPSLGLAYLLAVALGRWLRPPFRERRLLVLLACLAVLSGEAAFSHGRARVWEDSVRLWTDAIETFPERPGSLANRAFAFTDRGEAYGDLGRYGDALRDFEEALRLNPRTFRTYRSRAALLREMGALEACLRDLDAALALRPANVEALLERGRTHREMGNLVQSVEDLNRALAQDPTNALGMGERGLTLRRAGNLPEALADFDRAEALQPRNWAIRFNRAAVRRDAGDLSGAISDLREASVLNPDAYQPHYQLGLLYAERGDPRSAISEFSAALARNAAVPELYLDRAAAWRELGEERRAEEDMARAAALEDSAPGSRFRDAGPGR